MFLSKELMTIAGRSLKANITTLSPLVLPWTEQARFLANIFARKVRTLAALTTPTRSTICRAFDKELRRLPA